MNHRLRTFIAGWHPGITLGSTAGWHPGIATGCFAASILCGLTATARRPNRHR